MMYMGGIAGLAGAFLYEKAAATPIPVVGFLIALVCALLYRREGKRTTP